MPVTWSRAIEVLELEVARLSAAIELGQRDHDPMRDVTELLGADVPTTPIPADLLDRAAELTAAMARLQAAIQHEMDSIAGQLDHLLTSGDAPPRFIDARC